MFASENNSILIFLFLLSVTIIHSVMILVLSYSLKTHSHDLSFSWRLKSLQLVQFIVAIFNAKLVPLNEMNKIDINTNSIE